MTAYDESALAAKLIEHTRLKLSASLFMFLDNIRALATNKNLCAPYQTPIEFSQITNELTELAAALKDILSQSIDERLETAAKLEAAKKNVLELSESFYCYFSLNNLLSEIIANYRRTIMLEAEKEVPVDFHGFLHDCADFIEKDKSPELQSGNMSVLMKCFPLFMTKQKYMEYVTKGLKMLFQNESEVSINSVGKALAFKFLPVNMPSFGKYFPELKDFFDTMFCIEFDKLPLNELENLADSLEDNFVNLENISNQLSILYESMNFLTLIITFSKDLDYLLYENVVYKDAFYYIMENIKTNPENLTEENMDDLFDKICSELIDKIIADEKEGLLDSLPNDGGNYTQTTLDLYKIIHLISSVYYEMLSEQVYRIKSTLETDAPADNAFIHAACDRMIAYINTTLSNLAPKTQKLIKQLFLSCLPSPFSMGEFMDYSSYCIDNTLSYPKKLRILDAVGIVFETTGFINKINNHEHSDSCGHDHHHHENCSHHHH